MRHKGLNSGKTFIIAVESTDGFQHQTAEHLSNPENLVLMLVSPKVPKLPRTKPGQPTAQRAAASCVRQPFSRNRTQILVADARSARTEH